MIALIFSVIFFGTLFIFGWQLARPILNERRIEALIPLGAILGLSIYLFSLNILSYFINFKLGIYLLLLFFILLNCFFYCLNRKNEKTEWGIDKKWIKILFISCFLIMVLVGIIDARSFSSNEELNHLPFSATIAGGNLPAMDISAPYLPAQYHYGYNLFSAVISNITRLPIWFGADFHYFILIGILFLMSFLLIKDFCRNNFIAYFASLLMVFGGNWNFFYYGYGGLIGLISQPSGSAPFKFLSDMIFGSNIFHGEPVITYSRLNWVMLGLALTVTVVYLYFRAINSEGKWFRISFLAGVIFGFLSLSSELFFGLLAIVLFIYPFIFWSRYYFKISLIILLLGSFIAIFHGGIVTQTVKDVLFGGGFFLKFPFSLELRFASIFNSVSFLEWSWLIIFIIPVSLLFLRKHSQLGIFLISLIFISFSLPVFFNVRIWQGELFASNYLIVFSWNLIFGAFLGKLLLSFQKQWQKLLLIIFVLGVISQGLVYSVLFSVWPNLQRGQPLFGEPKLTGLETEVIGWIKDNTSIKDYFLTFGGESLAAQRNSRFVILSGRIAPGFYHSRDGKLPPYFPELETTPPALISYRNILKECDPASLKALNYRYFYVNENWPQGLEEKCLASNNLELKFSYIENQRFARIYLLP